MLRSSEGELTFNDGSLKVSGTYKILLDQTLFPEGEFAPGIATITPSTYEPDNEFLDSLRWTNHEGYYFTSDTVSLPLDIVVMLKGKQYTFTKPTVIFRSGKRAGNIVHECVILSMPNPILSVGTAARVAGAGTRGGRRKQKRHRRTLRKSRRNHRTK